MTEKQLCKLSLPYYTGQNRTVRVFVPSHEDGEKLPVIYMTDGQNIFEDNNPGQLGCWYTRETVSEVGKAIIVGIHNDQGPLQRLNELSPKEIGDIRFPPQMPDQLKKLVRQEGELFDDFVINTVMPEIEKLFPVETGRNAAAFCGSSSGGLQAYYTVLRHPERFCACGAFSPAFPFCFVDDVIKWTASTLNDSFPYLYLYSGAEGEPEREICESTEKVFEAISRYYPAERINKIIIREETHHENAWARVFKDFLHTFLSRRCEL